MGSTFSACCTAPATSYLNYSTSSPIFGAFPMKLRGIIPPIVTPMTADQEVDLPGMRKLIDLMLAKGVHGIFVLGTTGEFYALDDREKQAVVADAIAHVNGRSPVFAGTGAETTREVIRL